MVNRGTSKNMVLKKNKKGVFFTTLAIVILSLFIITFTFYSQVKERRSIQKRVETLNDFIFAIEENIPRQIRTTGFRVIFLFEKRIVESGNYISDLNSTFEEMFFNGTLYGETNTEIQALMSGATLPEIETSLKQKAEKISANLDFINPSISISQVDPWNLEITLTMNLQVEDKSKLVLWNKTSQIKTLVPLEGFEDPLYIINTNALVINKIIENPNTTFVQGSDISNLQVHSTNSYYKASATAPSFLDRLEGINNPNPNGIESLVNLQKLSMQGISVKDKSVVDYIYFSTFDPPACNILPAGMPSWFKLDNAHLADYQVSCV
jgi:hypothetical protein